MACQGQILGIPGSLMEFFSGLYYKKFTIGNDATIMIIDHIMFKVINYDCNNVYYTGHCIYDL